MIPIAETGLHHYWSRIRGSSILEEEQGYIIVVTEAAPGVTAGAGLQDCWRKSRGT